MVVDVQTVVRSLEAGRVVPFCQPLRELRTGRLMGLELPDGVILTKDRFFHRRFSLAEEASMLNRLTEQLLAGAPADIALRWAEDRPELCERHHQEGIQTNSPEEMEAVAAGLTTNGAVL